MCLCAYACVCVRVCVPVRLCACTCVCVGTTEKIFEEKKDLYDVYVDNQNVKTYREGLKPLLRLSAADKDKYRRLTEQR